jgi:hypothetical protein
MSKTLCKIALLLIALVAVTGADAQTRRHRPQQREPKEVEHPLLTTPVDKRDSMVTGQGAYAGRPYWAALAQCGGIYFKLNTLYADIAAHARAVKPDPKISAEYTRKLNEAIRTATVYFRGAERLLMTDRGLERVDAVLIYDGQSLASGDRIKSVEAGLSATKTCPMLYQACQQAYPKACTAPLTPAS